MGATATGARWKQAYEDVLSAIDAVDWPHGTGRFVIYPESGKRRGEGNGVTPIKIPCVAHLTRLGWVAEKKAMDLPPEGVLSPGDLDALLTTDAGKFALEWETGNISSSHRALNKLTVALLRQDIQGGFLVLPSRHLARYLTDRIGNIDELRPYFYMWQQLPISDGMLTLIAVEYDDVSTDVPRIPKGTDGRAVS